VMCDVMYVWIADVKLGKRESLSDLRLLLDNLLVPKLHRLSTWVVRCFALIAQSWTPPREEEISPEVDFVGMYDRAYLRVPSN
jgi:hypothetical protein